MVFIDEAGRMRESTSVDNLFDTEQRADFFDILTRRKPDCVVIGGFSIHTVKLYDKVKAMLQEHTQSQNPGDRTTDGVPGFSSANPMGLDAGGWGEPAAASSSAGGWGVTPHEDPAQSASSGLPLIYVSDEVAKIYQHSKRAEEEFPSLSLIAKYCVGLARYAQSPLNEYAALGSDLAAITFEDEAQQLVSPHSRLPFWK